MDDLISRQAAIDAVLHHGEIENHYTDLYYDGYCDGVYDSADILKDMPSAERRGRWEFDIDDKGWSWDYPYMCDQCGEWAEKEFNFCPKCGTKMEGKDHDEE